MMAAKTALTQRSFALEKPGCTDEVEEGRGVGNRTSSKSEEMSDAVSEFNVDETVSLFSVSSSDLSLRLRRLQQNKFT